MDRFPPEILLHIVNELGRYRAGPRRIVDYRLLRLAEPGPDGRLRQLNGVGLEAADTLQDLLRRGYSVVRAEWRPIPEGRAFSELWAHVVLHAGE